MTFDEIKTYIKDRLNLTSSSADTRIGLEINERYRRATSSVNLLTTRRGVAQQNATIGVTTMTFQQVEKLINVIDRSVTPFRVLQEITVEQLRNLQPSTNTFAQFYCILDTSTSSVTIEMDCIPQTTFTLYADAYINLSTISGSQSPVISEDYHDIIIHGVLADEYAKMEKWQRSDKEEDLYEARLAEYRYFLKTSAYLDITQGGNDEINSWPGGVPGGGGSSSVNGSLSYTQTGLITFDRTSASPGSRYPFAVQAGSNKVANLDADLLDGSDWNTVGVLPDAGLGLTDVTTNNVTSTKHGFAPKTPGDSKQYLNGAATGAFAQINDTDLLGLRHSVNGRLTLSSGVPVTSSNVVNATVVYFTPYKGDLLALYTSSKWQLYHLTEVSVGVPNVANQMYDVFVYDNGGVVTLEVVAWTNDTTRATAITLQDNVYVKSGSTNKRYLGSFRTTTVAGQTEDSFAKRYLWNYYNRVRRPLRVVDTTDSWNYTTATFRQANNNTANQVDVVVGVAEEPVEVFTMHAAANTNTAVAVVTAIGENGISKHSLCVTTFAYTAVANGYVSLMASLIVFPAIGRSYYTWLELSSAAGTTTWAGDLGTANVQTGIFGSIFG